MTKISFVVLRSPLDFDLQRWKRSKGTTSRWNLFEDEGCKESKFTFARDTNLHNEWACVDFVDGSKHFSLVVRISLAEFENIEVRAND
jgi:hypothetical protein